MPNDSHEHGTPLRRGPAKATSYSPPVHLERSPGRPYSRRNEAHSYDDEGLCAGPTHGRTDVDKGHEHQHIVAHTTERIGRDKH